MKIIKFTYENVMSLLGLYERYWSVKFNVRDEHGNPTIITISSEAMGVSLKNEYIISTRHSSSFIYNHIRRKFFKKIDKILTGHMKYSSIEVTEVKYIGSQELLPWDKVDK